VSVLSWFSRPLEIFSPNQNEEILATKKKLKYGRMGRKTSQCKQFLPSQPSGKLEQYDTDNGGKIIYGQKDVHI
jgi:hypothetical protein